MRITLAVAAAAAACLSPAALAGFVRPKQCVASTGLELEGSLADASCTGIKTTGFNLSETRLQHVLANSGVSARRLDALVLSGTKLEEGAVIQLGEAIGGGVLLPEKLIFWNNGLDSTATQSSEAVFALIGIVRSAASRLRELHFTDNVLLDEGAEGLGAAVQAAGQLQKLVLSGNGIGPPGVASLSAHLAGSAVQSLAITGVERGANSWMTNWVGAAGGIGLSRLLEPHGSNTGLRTLVLSGTNVGDDGAIELARGIRGSGLTLLDLHRNSISDAGAVKLAAALAEAPVLKLVILTANKIGDEGAAALADAVRRNPSLTVVDVEMNMRVSEQAKQALAAAFGERADVNVVRTAAHTEL